MSLPPVEKTPVMLMRFTPKASRVVIAEVVEALTGGGIIVVESEGLYDENGKIIEDGAGDNAVVLGLTTTQKLLENEAEALMLVKPCRTPHEHIPLIMEHFTCGAREDFVKIKLETRSERRLVPWFERQHDGDYDADGLFTSAERALLVESMIAAIPAPKSLKADSKRRSTPLIDAMNKLRNIKEVHTSTLREVLDHSGFVDVVSPVHIPHIKNRILKETAKIKTGPPLQAIRDYYGEGVAFYFAWMHHMTCWYMITGLVGLAAYILRKKHGDTVDDCELLPFVGLITFCWGVLCVRCWERRERELAYKWGTYVSKEGDGRSLGIWPGFKGKLKRSPITGKMERYYPASNRHFKCAVSAIITVFLLAGACVVMVISMNLQGYVHVHSSWGDEAHPLYYPFFAHLAEEGAIFDAKSLWKSFLPIILRVLVVNNMNQKYSQLAEKLSEWENHETVQAHHNSIVLKRVLFEAFDAYIILFYLAIFERDMFLLRCELAGAFHIDTLRRVATECVIPFAVKHFAKDKVGASKKDDDMKGKKPEGHLTSEAELEEYDTFDDFIEMLIQFGYVTLFASAYPLAAFIAIGANMIEMRADAWKLDRLFRRVTPIRAYGIGMWESSLKCIMWLSAGTNLIIFAFTSSQLRQWLPDYYVTDDDGRSMPKATSSAEILLLVLVIEHALLIIGVLVKSAIPSMPKRVRVEVQKWRWYHENLSSETRSRTLKGSSEEVDSLSHAQEALLFRFLDRAASKK